VESSFTYATIFVIANFNSHLLSIPKFYVSILYRIVVSLNKAMFTLSIKSHLWYYCGNRKNS